MYGVRKCSSFILLQVVDQFVTDVKKLVKKTAGEWLGQGQNQVCLEPQVQDWYYCLQRPRLLQGVCRGGTSCAQIPSFWLNHILSAAGDAGSFPESPQLKRVSVMGHVPISVVICPQQRVGAEADGLGPLPPFTMSSCGLSWGLAETEVRVHILHPI